MEQREFLERFLPDYEKRLEKVIAKGGNKKFAIEANSYNWFSEALQNFANKICAAQRKICAEYFGWEGETLYDPVILNAEQPKIDAL